MSNGIETQGFLASSRNPFSYEKVEQLNRDIQTSWLTLDEITQQLNLFEDESQDSYLSGLEVATRMAIEDYLGMSIFPITWKVYYGSTNVTGTQVSLDLPEITPNSQLVSNGVVINSVTYYNNNTPPVLTTLASSQYFYDPTGNKVVCASLPANVNNIMSNPIMVTYTTSANFYAQYPVIKQAGLLLLTHLYNNRSNTTREKLNELPYGVTQLLRPYKPLVM
jgi:hypothetical protein